MSRIGKKAVPIPSGVTAKIEGQEIKVKGPKGELTFIAPEEIALEQKGAAVAVNPRDESKRARSMWGMARTRVANLMTGVTAGYTETLEIQGVGYRAAMDGKDLVLNVGFSHPVRFNAPDGISYALDGQTKVAIIGIDKQAVGEEAARIRRVRPPEPYKGKGIRYEGEVVRRKAGKAGKAK